MNPTSIYVSDTSNGVVTKYHDDGCSTIVAKGLNGPTGLVTDNRGNLLYVANSVSGTIEKFDLNGNNHTFASSLNKPMGLALDRSGNLYAANAGDGSIVKFDSNGHKTTFASKLDLTNPSLAFDRSENLYVSTTRTVEKFSPSGTHSTILTAMNFVYGLTFDCCDQLFASFQNVGSIQGLPGGGFLVADNPYTFTPAGLAFDRGNGHLYVACGQSVRRYHPDGCGTIFATGFVAAQYLAVHA